MLRAGLPPATRAGAAGFRTARPRGIPAHGAFFPAAILCSLVAIPAWAALYQDRPALGLWHAHEMLFGFGLAVVAGFLLTGSDRRLLALLLAAWVLARFAVLPGMALAGSVGAAGFACLLAGTGAQRFLRGARKGRNRVFGLVLAGMAVAEFLYQAGALGWLPTGQQRGNMLILDLLTLLMLQMGGRVIPAATAGALYRRGMVLQQRVQPWIEAAIGALMACVIVLDQVPGDAAPLAVALIGAAVLTGMRLIRWGPWSIAAIPELWGLHLAYGWLAAGLALRGLAGLGYVPPLAGVHALGIGGLGTLTAVMMVRTVAGRSTRKPSVPASIGVVAALLSVAASLRIAATFGGGTTLIPAAAAAWTLAFLLLGAIYLRLVRAG